MSEGIMTPEEFRRQTNVSRETLERLQIYVDLLRQWTSKINLVSQDSLTDVWRRHLLDSAQLMDFCPAEGKAVDLGSGAGFPGLVLAILGKSDMQLIEADQRKSAFLREAIRLTGTQASVVSKRIEDVPSFEARTITARAFAPLAKILDLAEKFIGSETTFLLLKGRNVSEELTQAHKQWKMGATSHPSQSDPSGWILRLERPVREFPGRIADRA